MTNHHTAAEGHAESATGVSLTTLDPNSGLVTTINTYTVTPVRAEEVLETSYVRRTTLSGTCRGSSLSIST